MQSILLRLAASSALAIVLVMLAGCGVQPDDSLGQAYVAPATLTLRRDLRQKNSTVAVLKHGDRVSILDVRRRYVKVRTSKGVEGWLDSLELLSPEQMAQIRKEREQMSHLPSEGMATVYDALNVHIQPGRQSPAFAKIPEGGSVAVLGQRVVPKVTGPARIPTLVVPKPALARRHGKKKASKNTFRLPPKPEPPKPPANWRMLPGEMGASDLGSTQATKKPAETAPVVLENWSSVRTKNGEYGWVLSRNLIMSIPDDVAQYAEGKRITSYFDLGAVHDPEKGERHDWLWTTLSATEPYDFDSWRVFLWNLRRHRYETSYRARDLVGYFPVHVDAAEPGVRGRRFALIVKDTDGILRRKSYQFDGVRVHLVGTEDYHPEAEAKANELQQAKPHKPAGWLAREWLALKQKLAKYRR